MKLKITIYIELIIKNILNKVFSLAHFKKYNFASKLKLRIFIKQVLV